MGKDGRYIACPAERMSMMVSRVTCLVQKYDDCSFCPNSRFALRIPEAVGNQVVLCPRWESGSSGSPSTYVPMRREACIFDRPFSFCVQCPNRLPAEAPRNTEGWVDDPNLRMVAT